MTGTSTTNTVTPTFAAANMMTGAGLFGTAEVVGRDPDSRFALVRHSDDWEVTTFRARLALGNGPIPSTGDQVLIAGDAPDDLFVIACLSRPADQRLKTKQGYTAERHQTADGAETLRVLSPDDKLLIELDARDGVTRLRIPSGSVELTTGAGDILFRSAGNLRFEGKAIELHAKQRIALSISSGLSAVGTWLRLLSDRLQVGSEKISLTAREGRLQMDKARVTSDDLAVEADRCHVKARHAETVAETVVQRSGNVYCFVRDLMQNQAGRLRTYVSGLSHFRSKRAYFSSEETFNVDGEKINLG